MKTTRTKATAGSNQKEQAEQYQGWIDIKRSKRKWETSHRPLFLSIGLVISLLLVNIAFMWRTPADQDLLQLISRDDTVDELIDVPISEQPPPPPPKKTVELFVIKEVEEEVILEEIEVELDVEVTEESQITEVVFEEATEEEVEEIFTIVEERPSPVGGMEAFNTYLAENLKYPSMALRHGVSGKVFVQFVVEKDGSIQQIQVVKGIGSGCDEEAVRVLAEAPNWNPGKQRGRAVRVQMILPVWFVLKNVQL